VAYIATRNASVLTLNKRWAMSDKDTVKAQLWEETRHGSRSNSQNADRSTFSHQSQLADESSRWKQWPTRQLQSQITELLTVEVCQIHSVSWPTLSASWLHCGWFVRLMSWLISWVNFSCWQVGMSATWHVSEMS